MLTVKRDSDLTPFTTFRIPAECAALVEWDTIDDLAEAVALSDLPRPFLTMGGGSNLLFTRPFRGTVLRRRNQVTLNSVCEAECAAGRWGFENLSGIPGSIYGAVVQNAGAYGTEMKDVVRAVDLFDLESRVSVTLSAADLCFSYRHSLLKEPHMAGRYVITGVEFRASASGPSLGHGALRSCVAPDADPMEVRRVVLALRGSKLPDPAEVGSAGSFFRNPELTASEFKAFSAQWPDAPRYELSDGRVKVPAAWLIDRAGLKGAAVGGAVVWPLQPLVIANPEGRASADDVLALEEFVRSTVAEKFNINLIPEVQHI